MSGEPSAGGRAKSRGDGVVSREEQRGEQFARNQGKSCAQQPQHRKVDADQRQDTEGALRVETAEAAIIFEEASGDEVSAENEKNLNAVRAEFGE